MSIKDALDAGARLADAVSRRGFGALTATLLPAEAPGDVSYVLLKILRRDRWRLVGVIVELSVMRHLVVAGWRKGGAALLGHQAPEERWVDVVAEYLSSDGLEAVSPNALDAALALLEALRRDLPVAGGRWRLETHGEWTGPGSGAGVELGGDGALEWRGLLRAEHAAGGVVLYLPSEKIAQVEQIRLETPAKLDAAIPLVVAGVRKALAARDVVRRGSLSVGVAGDKLLAALRGAVKGTLGLKTREGSYPHTWPCVMVELTDELGTRCIASLTGGAGGNELVAGRYRRTFTAAADLDAALSGLRDAVIELEGRLTSDKLLEGKSYRVLQPFGMLKKGDQASYHGGDYNPHDSFTVHRFSSSNGIADLNDAFTPDLEILNAIHEYLAPSRRR